MTCFSIVSSSTPAFNQQSGSDPFAAGGTDGFGRDGGGLFGGCGLSLTLLLPLGAGSDLGVVPSSGARIVAAGASGMGVINVIGALLGVLCALWCNVGLADALLPAFSLSWYAGLAALATAFRR